MSTSVSAAAGKRPAATALASTRHITSKSSVTRSACSRAKYRIAGPSATIVEA